MTQQRGDKRPFIFSKMIRMAAMQGILPRKNKESVEWFQQKAKQIRIGQSELAAKAARAGRTKNSPVMGSMFMFSYDPKTKEDLPFYDAFPCIFVIKVDRTGFYGLNFHYLPLPLRAKLLDALYPLKTTEHLTESTRLAMSYRILAGAAKYKLFKPCIKKYLYKQVRTRFIEISPLEWDAAIFLPTQQFIGASEAKVHRWSVSQIF